MGQAASNLSTEDIQDIKGLTTFTPHELKRLHKRFKKIDKDGNGVLSADELAQNPLVGRVMAIFDTDNDTNIDFREFAIALNLFASTGNDEQKLRFLFEIYDLDNDGKIGNGELFQVLKMMVGENLTDAQLQQIVDKTIIEATDGKSEFINFADFKKMVGSSDFGSKLTINV